MSAQSNITFKQYIPKETNEIEIKVDRKYLSVGTLFRIERLLLVPDYFSIQAAQWDMDPTLKDMEYPMYLQIKFANTAIGNSWTHTGKNIQINDLLKSLNRFFDAHKPPGINLPLVMFDWVLKGYESAESNIKDYHRNTAPLFYDANFQEDLHNNVMPDSIKNLPFINSLRYPTTTESDVQNFIRIRMHLAPNVIAAFANDGPLKALGFSEKSIPEKSTSKQIRFFNESINAYKFFISDTIIRSTVIDDTANFKLSTYFNQEIVKSPRGSILTNRTRERKNLEFGEDIDENVKKLAADLNLNVGFQYFTADKKFKFVIPANAAFTVDMLVDSLLADRLGYGIVEKINSLADPKVVVTRSDISQFKDKAVTLIYDTSIVTVCIDRFINLQGEQFNLFILTHLEPNPDGTMTSKNVCTLPCFEISFSEPTVILKLYTFNEMGKPIPLQWKTGAYLQGTLVSCDSDDPTSKKYKRS